MSDLKVCRICLRTQCKVYKYDRYQLKAYYEEVMAQKMDHTDGLPQYFCFECATILHKFHKFKEKCWMGHRVLKQVQTSWKGKITYEAVHEIDRAILHLKSPLEILTVTNRVKTYVTKDTTETSGSECEAMETDDEKPVKVKDIEEEDEQLFLDEGPGFDNNYDSDDPIEDLKTVPLLDNPVISTEETNNKETNLKDTDYNNILNSINSPKTIFVDVKKDLIVLKSEPIKERKKSFSEYGLKKVNPKFAKPKINVPDKNSWEIHTLNEEEAVREFQKRAECKTYKDAAYKCVDCFKGFSKEDMLKRHMKLRHSETLGRLECRFCHKRFKWDSKLRRHMVEHFTRYKCLLCNIVVCVETTAILHEEWHKGEPKRCHHCGETFRHRSTYYTHLRKHRSEHVCSVCGMSFVSPSGLHMHMKIKHIDHSNIDEDDDDAPVNTFCERCDMRFETRKAYEEHLFHSAMHVDGAEDETDKSGTKKKILGKRTQEIILGKRISKKNGANNNRKLDIIVKRNTNCEEETQPLKPCKGRRARRRVRCYKKPTTCNQCGKHFETQAACMKHHQAEHPRTSFYSERHICEICGASLAPGSVTMHQNMHSRQKEFPCDTCARKFHTMAGLKRHLLTHTGEKPFACSLCDKRFTQSNSMKLHYRTFHLQQPYPKRFKKDLFKCVDGLKRHLVTHTKEKPFACSLCDNPFTQSNSMKLHYRTFHLQQHFPKRNRRKRKDAPPSMPASDKSVSEDSAPEPETRQTAANEQTTESLHYLTLS